jgi:hypothetical protein
MFGFVLGRDQLSFAAVGSVLEPHVGPVDRLASFWTVGEWWVARAIGFVLGSRGKGYWLRLGRVTEADGSSWEVGGRVHWLRLGRVRKVVGFVLERGLEVRWLRLSRGRAGRAQHSDRPIASRVMANASALRVEFGFVFPGSPGAFERVGEGASASLPPAWYGR